MLQQLINWSLNNRLLVVFASCGLLIWGGYETQRMPVDVLPDLTAPSVTVVTEAHGMAPTDVERLITFPIETALNGATAVRRIRSNSGIGLSIVIVEFEWDTNIYRARQLVAEKLQLVRAELPANVNAPIMAPIASVMGEIMFIALKSDQHDTMTLKTTTDWQVRRRLLAVTGVADVITIGGDSKQYQVNLFPGKLARYGISVDQVIEAVENSYANSSAGFIQTDGQEFLIQGIGKIEQINDIGLAVISQRNQQPILVRDVAEVRIGPAIKRGTGSHNGESAVILGILKQPDVNTLALTQALDQTIKQIQNNLPAGMTLEANVFRQSDFIEVAVDNLLTALWHGAILVVLILIMFLMSGQATLITLLAIPISMLTAILMMKAMGSSINTMTLGGLAIALGSLVDDAIIVVENCLRRLKANQQTQDNTLSSLKLIANASHEILSSILFATLIIILVFIPLFFLSGIEGKLLQPLGYAYIVSIAASLLVALTLTPCLCSFLLVNSKAVRENNEAILVIKLKKIYQPVLLFSLKHWLLCSVFSLVLLFLAIVALWQAGQSFLPEFNEGSLTVSAVTLPGTSLNQSDQLGKMAETIILKNKEVIATSRRTGRAESDPHALQVFASEIDVSLKMAERSKSEFLAELRKNLSTIPGMDIVIGQPISHRIDHMLSGSRANIAIKIFGTDRVELRNLAEQIKHLSGQVDGAVDLAIDNPADIPLLQIRYKRRALARYGLSIHKVSELIETAYAGKKIAKILEDQGSFDLVVRFHEPATFNLNDLNATQIITEAGARIPLHAVAEIKISKGPNSISRENSMRKIVVIANVAGRDLAGVVKDIKQRIKQGIELPPGYYIEYGGQFKNAEQAANTLYWVGFLVILCIFFLLYIVFSSIKDALLIMLNLPLALIGGVLGVFLADGILSVASIIGFITLFGIATRNGVMMVSHIHHLVQHQETENFYQAVKQGAMERLSPILMTALGTGLALIPLALSADLPGSEIQAPMAIVILFGLISSTFLNMIIIPALYYRFGSMKHWKPETAFINL